MSHFEQFWLVSLVTVKTKRACEATFELEGSLKIDAVVKELTSRGLQPPEGFYWRYKQVVEGKEDKDWPADMMLKERAEEGTVQIIIQKQAKKRPKTEMKQEEPPPVPTPYAAAPVTTPYTATPEPLEMQMLKLKLDAKKADREAAEKKQRDKEAAAKKKQEDGEKAKQDKEKAKQDKERAKELQKTLDAFLYVKADSKDYKRKEEVAWKKQQLKQLRTKPGCPTQTNPAFPLPDPVGMVSVAMHDN